MKHVFSFIVCLLLFSCNNTDARIADSADSSSVNANGDKTPDSAGSTVVIDDSNTQDGCDLVRKITRLQRQYVKESYGINAGQCFTDLDLQRFISDGVPARIVQQLRTDADFLCIINALRRMTPQNRTAVLDSAVNTYRKSWAELGMDPQTTPAAELRRGQTEAGRRADRLIAEAVVNLVNEMLRARQ